MQSEVRFNRVPEKVPEKVRLGTTGFWRRFRRKGGLGTASSLNQSSTILSLCLVKPNGSDFGGHYNLTSTYLFASFFLSRHDASARMQGKRWSGALAIMVGIDYPGKKNQ